METQQRESQEPYVLYSPCYLFQQLIKAFFKCFGHEENQYASPTQRDEVEDPLVESETEMKSTEDQTITSSEVRIVSRRPPRPPVSTGSGGQTN